MQLQACYKPRPHAHPDACTPTHTRHTYTLRSVYTYLQWRRMSSSATDNVAICGARQCPPCSCCPLLMRCCRHLLRIGSSSRCWRRLCCRINCKKKWKKCNQKIYIKYDKLKAHKSEKAFKNISKKKRKKLILNWMKSIRKQQQLQATIAKVNNTILWHVKKAFKTFYSTEKEEERETFLYRM